jgi:hypothetical protein
LIINPVDKAALMILILSKTFNCISEIKHVRDQVNEHQGIEALHLLGASKKVSAGVLPNKADLAAWQLPMEET